MCLFLLSLVLAPRPAQAQSGGSWNGRPCDAQGNLLDNPPHNDDGYVLTGPQTGTLSNTYPVPMIKAALAYPSLYGDYLGAGEPLGIDALGVSPKTVTFPFYPGSPDTPNERVGVYTPDFPLADNYGSGGEGSYSIDAAHGGPSSGPVNGSVTGDLSRQLVCYFHMYWSGPGPQPASATFLVTTYVYAQASVGYPLAGSSSTLQTSGLSATATASDGSPFNETASASAGDGASGGGVPMVSGHHLVQAAVDPQTGVAEVYVNGTAHWEVSNTVPYQTAGEAWAGGGSLVQASAQQDSREVSISCPAIEDSYYKAANPDPIHGDRYQHLRDPITGAIVTDSVATYSPTAVFSTMDNTKPGAWIASDTFSASTPGFVNPMYSWSSDSNGRNMAGVDLTQQSVNINWFFGTSDNLPKKSSVRVDVTDGPPSPVPATAANTFGITWHLPYEAPNPVPYSVVPGKYQLQPARLGPVSHDEFSSKSPTPAQHFDWEATINGASVVAKVAGQEEIAGGLEIVEAIAKIAKPYTDADAEPSTQLGATNNAESWSDSMQLYDNDTYGGGNIPADLQGNPDGYLYCDMYIYQVLHYKDKYWYADGYNSHGYDGTSNNIVYLRTIDDVSDEFYYVEPQPSGGSPLPPHPVQPVE